MKKRLTLALTLALTTAVGASTSSFSSWTPVNRSLYGANKVATAKAYAAAIEASIQTRLDGLDARVITLESGNPDTVVIPPIDSVVAPTQPPDTLPSSPSGTFTIVRQANFADGTLGGFGTWETATAGVTPSDLPKITVINDPTGILGGKVAQFRYRSLVGGDDNTSLVQPGLDGPPGNEAALPIGQVKVRRYDMKWYITPEWKARANADGAFQGKLLYIKQSQYYGQYPTSRFVTGMMGNEFYVNYTMNDVDGNSDRYRKYGYFPLNLQVGWHSLRVEIRRESAVGAANGIIRVWVDGNKIWDRSDVQLSLTAWVGQTVAGHTWTSADFYMDNVLIGQQTNVVQGTPVQQDYDMLRYVKDVVISDLN